MGLWGLEVKPEEPKTYNPKNEQGKLLHMTQATLGAGLSKANGVIQYSIGDKAPIYMCSLLPNEIECCRLNLEIEHDDEPVEFSVTGGDRSIHLSGFLESREHNASAPNSGVVTEEKEDEPTKDNKAERKSRVGKAPETESSKSGEKMDFGTDEEPSSHKKRKAKAAAELLDCGQESVNKSKKKKNAEADEQVLTASVLKKQEASQICSNNAMKSSKTPDKSTDSNEEATVEHQTSSGNGLTRIKRFYEIPGVVTIYENGLRIDELKIGTGTQAIPGDTIYYPLYRKAFREQGDLPFKRWKPAF